jgi:2-C-methyl-D-erythritol 4-phosphate cytidylyltransferase/2-C-methyl-D-erythritol 2,4-cyclodiphosphate synthase
VLCGIVIPFDRGLLGHSDADVAMHALTDAIFGALAEGDIGQWFPPSDPAWQGAASEIFLRKALDRAAARGYAITHLDCTIVCEAPRIGPYAAEMRAALGRIAGLDTDRISVKATTSEQLGFTGRGEGIAALATATLVRP